MSHHLKEVFHAVKGKANEVLGQITGSEIRKFRGEKEKLAGHLQNKFDLDYDTASFQATRLIFNSEKESLKL